MADGFFILQLSEPGLPEREEMENKKYSCAQHMRVIWSAGPPIRDHEPSE